ncbi:MAG: cobalamide ABC transporter substrate-binding protein [Desulfobacteraceae bacterium]|nr:MAG: cobalamide ABC transporter substrate-binding protein [Desulfobacteraceae bacterium]
MSKNTTLVILAVWIAAGVLAGAVYAGNTPSKTSDPGEVYSRVVALGPLITDMIYLLEADNRLVGVTSYCTIPEGTEKKEIIGTVMQMNVEKIVSLRPDAVFASTLTRPKQIQSLRNQGIRVIKFNNPTHFDGICEMFLNIGKLLGRTRHAQQLINQTREQVSAIAEKAKDLPKRSVFIQIGLKPLKTSEQGTFISNYIELAGGSNIARVRAAGVYNRENVLKENPDVILVATMGSSRKAAEKEKDRWMTFGMLKAVQSREVHVLDPDIVCSPTPVTFVKALEAFYACIHPQGVSPVSGGTQ